MADKVFFGNVKEITNDYGTMYNIGITQDDINKLEFNDKGFANVTLKKSKNDKWYMEIPQYEKKESKGKTEQKDNSVNEDLPF